MPRRAAAPEWPGDADLGWTKLGWVREVVISQIPVISGNSMLWRDLTALFDLKSLGSFFGWSRRRAAAPRWPRAADSGSIDFGSGAKILSFPDLPLFLANLCIK